MSPKKREEEGMREERKERPWENGSWREAGWWCWVQGHSGFFWGKGAQNMHRSVKNRQTVCSLLQCYIGDKRMPKISEHIFVPTFSKIIFSRLATYLKVPHGRIPAGKNLLA